MDKDAEAFRTISEVARDLGVPQHVLRFWETKFPQIRPLKRGGGRRYYRRDEVALLKAVRGLLYDEGYTIKGVQRLLKEQGVRAVAALGDAPGNGSSLLPDAHDPNEADHPAESGRHEEHASAADLRRRLAEIAREIEICSAILLDARGEPRRA